jgi:hypothetical protein
MPKKYNRIESHNNNYDEKTSRLKNVDVREHTKRKRINAKLEKYIINKNRVDSKLAMHTKKNQ